MNKIIFLFLLILGACKGGISDSRIKPDKLLSAQQMRDILIEIHLLEAELMDSSRVKGVVQYTEREIEILAKYNIDTLVLHQNFAYYLDQDEQLADIYQAVIDSLQSQRANVKK